MVVIKQTLTMTRKTVEQPTWADLFRTPLSIAQPQISISPSQATPYLVLGRGSKVRYYHTELHVSTWHLKRGSKSLLTM